MSLWLLTLALAAETSSAVVIIEENAPVAQRVAVSELDNSGVPENEANVFVSALLGELRKLRATSVVSYEEIRLMLDAEVERQLTGCEGAEDSCLAELADALGADALIIGGLAIIDDTTVITLKRVDQKRAAVVTQSTQRLVRAGGEELLAAVGPAVEELFPDHPLREGQVRGAPEELILRLRPPPLPTWVFYSGAALSAVAGTASIFTGARFGGEYGRYRSLAESATVVDGRALKSQERVVVDAESQMWAAVIATSGLVLSTLIVVPLTDWERAAELR